MKNTHNHRSFLKSSALAGGGMMLSFSWFSGAKDREKVPEMNLPEQWSELTGYVKITPDNIINILCPNPEFEQNVMTSLPMVQGAVADGIGQSFDGALTHKDGAAEQNNLHNYRMIRHNEAPKKIDVHFVENNIDPTGLGKPPFPPVFGAVANALFKTTGKRYYNQPFKIENKPKS